MIKSNEKINIFKAIHDILYFRVIPLYPPLHPLWGTFMHHTAAAFYTFFQ